MKTVFRVLAVFFMLAVALPAWAQLRAQVQAEVGPIQESTLQQVSPDSVPAFANYYMASLFTSNTFGPPIPFDSFPTLPLYWMGGNSYIVDDRTVDYAALQAQAESDASAQSGGGATMMRGGSMAGASGGGFQPDTPSGGGSSPSYSFDTNGLWLEILLGTNIYNLNTNLATILVHNTTPDLAYQLLWATNLPPANILWTVEQNFLGAEGANLTPLTVPILTNNALYFRVLAYGLDSVGDGLPDWWQLLYFGYLGVDPYGDPAGDGWSNLQKYYNGWNPFVFYTPVAPGGFNTALNGNGSVTLTWYPASGPVTGYTILRQTNQNSSFATIATVSSSQTTYTDNSVPSGNQVEYEIEANYAGGRSAPTDEENPLFEPKYTVQAAIVRGPQGGLYLVASAIPQNVATIRVVWYGGVMPYPLFDFGLNNFQDFTPAIHNANGDYFDVAVTNFNNGFYQIPTNKISLYGDYWFEIYGMGSNGKFGRPISAPSTNDWIGVNQDTAINIPFMDGRTNIQQNINFQLRAAFGSDGSGGGSLAFTMGSYTESERTNYIYSSFYYEGSYYDYTAHSWYPGPVRNEFQPFEVSSLYDYFAYVPGTFNTDGWLTNGVAHYYDPLEIDNASHTFQTYNYVAAPSHAPIPAILGVDSSRYILSIVNEWQGSGIYAYPDTFAISLAGASFSTSPPLVTLAASYRNIYGLPLQSVEHLTSASPVTYGNTPVGQTFSPPLGVRSYLFDLWFQEYAQPSLSTVAYYFARPQIEPFPGEPNFQVTNTTPSPLIVPVGQQFYLTAWAKQALNNGYSNVFAYPQQYFDKAFKSDVIGNITTNQTAILSEYGDFFPTEPGKIILTTKPDGATGSTGQCAVNVIKLQLDVNHDGNMDLTFGGPDNTSADTPFTFWANNNYDRLRSVDCPLACDTEQDDYLTADCPYTPNVATPDYAYQDAAGNAAIPCIRDLEDYTRLWTAGLSNVLAVMPINYTVQLVLTGDAQLRIFRAYEANGGTNYLFDPVTASNQVANAATLYIGLLSSSSPITLSGRGNLGEHFIFCGAHRGTAQVDLQVLDGSYNVVADTTAYIQIQDIKEMYERWTVGDNAGIPATNTAYLAVDGITNGMTKFQYDLPTDTNTPYILFVHGWNMKTWEKDRYTESAFKRLYWQGYQGRFGSFRWPTGNGFSGLIQALLDARNYDNSESNAWASASGLFNKLTDLNVKYPDKVYLMAHSMGNVVAGEALRLAGTSQVVNTYVAMQAAIPAHCYDALTPTNSTRTPPDRYAHYYTDGSPCYLNATAGAGSYVNFYNTNDYALGWWKADQTFKPDSGIAYPGYGYSSSSGFYKITGAQTNSTHYLSFPANTYEIFAYGDPAWSYALGAQANVGGAFKSGVTYNQVDLGANPYNFGSAHKGHSAQFRSDNASRATFWNTFLIQTGLKEE